ncbi:FASCICLIN-LIKE ARABINOGALACTAN PROTEIN [Salix viminalis]|uniref:FASCICLIN-LIKE ARABINOGALACTAN PROTEIN n=1 Tax=Salix viminalis TaxID=40686 RepID=A0A9Q0NWQ0_SALVM|nr:FASCICLIN-LIKE ARABINOGALACTAN PROTEIN [Salix viminalis]
MKRQISFSFSLVLLFLHCSQTLSQPPTAAPAKASAAATAPPQAATSAQASPPVMVPVQVSKGPVNVIKILQKAGHFAILTRLIKSTQEDIQLFSQLNDSRDGVTIFAPTDGAFSAIIKSGVLNSLTDHQKIELVQFHIIPRVLSTANFQTVSNPITTLAGSGSRFTLDVITTENIFAPKPLAPAPAPPQPKKDDGEESPMIPEDTSGSVTCMVHNTLFMFGVGIVAAAIPL